MSNKINIYNNRNIKNVYNNRNIKNNEKFFRSNFLLNKLKIPLVLCFLSFNLGYLSSSYITNFQILNINSKTNLNNNITYNFKNNKNTKTLEKIIIDENNLKREFKQQSNEKHLSSNYDKFEKFGSKYPMDDLIIHSKKIYSKYKTTINNSSEIYNIPLEIILGVLGRETAEENSISLTGAYGIMQLFDSAVESVLRNIYTSNFKKSNLYEYSVDYFSIKNKKSDTLEEINLKKLKRKQIITNIKKNPKLNIEAGIAYISYLKEIFNGNNSLAIMAYHDGLGNILKYLEWQIKYDSEINYNHQLITSKKLYTGNVDELLKQHQDLDIVYRMFSNEKFMRRFNNYKKKKKFIKMSYLADVYRIAKEVNIDFQTQF